MSGPEDVGYGLVYPFVCVVSNGGRWDDEAFVVGARFGQISTELNARPHVYQAMVEPDLVPQLDLLAMHEGYSMTHETAIEGAWEHVTFTVAAGPERQTVVLNPSAIGNPDESPVLFVGADLRALLNPCECGGVNGFHSDACPGPATPTGPEPATLCVHGFSEAHDFGPMHGQHCPGPATPEPTEETK